MTLEKITRDSDRNAVIKELDYTPERNIIPKYGLGRAAYMTAFATMIHAAAFLGLNSAMSKTEQAIDPVPIVETVSEAPKHEPPKKNIASLMTDEEVEVYKYTKLVLSNRNRSYKTWMGSLMSQVNRESDFNWKAVSRAGAEHWYQTMPKLSSADSARADAIAKEMMAEHPELVYEKLMNTITGTDYFFDNYYRFMHVNGHKLNHENAKGFALLAYNMGPSALEGILSTDGFMTTDVEEFVEKLDEQIAKNEPIEWVNRYSKNNRVDTTTVSKLKQASHYYKDITKNENYFKRQLPKFELAMNKGG